MSPIPEHTTDTQLCRVRIRTGFRTRTRLQVPSLAQNNLIKLPINLFYFFLKFFILFNLFEDLFPVFWFNKRLIFRFKVFKNYPIIV